MEDKGYAKMIMVVIQPSLGDNSRQVKNWTLMFNPNNFLFRKTMTNVYFKCILQNLSPAFIFFRVS